MATDNIYPTGINATTGKPEIATTAYSSIAGDFISALDGASGTINQTIQEDSAVGVSLSVYNTNVAGTASLTAGTGISTFPGVSIQSFGPSHATADLAGCAVIVCAPNDTKAAKFLGIETDTSDPAPFEFYSGYPPSATKTFRIGIEGVDPITITPTALAANTNNYNPTGFAGAEVVRISASGAVDLTGLVAPTTGSRLVILQNAGTEIITLKHDVTSTAANRFLNSTTADISLGLSMALVYLYDDTLSRWRDVGMNIEAGGGAFVALDGGSTGEQIINQDVNGNTNLAITNANAGVNGTAGFSLEAETAQLSMAAFSDAYTIAEYQNAARIAASTGANGFMIDNTGGNPLKLQVSGANYLTAATTGVTMRAGAQDVIAANVGGRYASFSTPTGNVGAGEDVLYSLAVEGATLDVDGKVLRFKAVGTFANTAATKQVRVRFGSAGTNLVLDSTAAYAAAARTWTLDGYVMRTGAATQTGGGTFLATSAATAMLGNLGSVTGLDQTLANDVTFQITGEATNNDDIILTSAVLWFE